MSAKLIRALLGLQDIEQAAAGGTVNRTVSVNGVSSVYTINRLNASNFPILAAATADQVAAAGGAATYPGPAIGEILARQRAPVADLAALRAVPSASPVDGQAVWVKAVRAWFAWDTVASGTDDGVSLITPTDSTGGGRWRKQLAYTADVSVAVYADVAALQATPAPSDNTLHLVEGEGLYQFDAASAAVADGTFIVNPASGAGQFVMRYRDRAKLALSEIRTSSGDATTGKAYVDAGDSALSARVEDLRLPPSATATYTGRKLTAVTTADDKFIIAWSGYKVSSIQYEKPVGTLVATYTPTYTGRVLTGWTKS